MTLGGITFLIKKKKTASTPRVANPSPSPDPIPIRLHHTPDLRDLLPTSTTPTRVPTPERNSPGSRSRDQRISERTLGIRRRDKLYRALTERAIEVDENEPDRESNDPFFFEFSS
jgi:hypothetical protein